MNSNLKTLICGLAGSCVMTGGSALMSVWLKENFREPDHLGSLAKRLIPGVGQENAIVVGWAAHGAMGLAFAAVYCKLWEDHRLRPDGKNALLLGSASGIIGLLIWKATFKTHPFPPRTNYTLFYGQRIPAHLLFAIGATLAYRVISSPTRPTTCRSIHAYSYGSYPDCQD